MSRVLVTGATGFIGKNLVAALAARGDDVTCLVRSTSSVAPLPKACRWATGDVTEPDSLPAAMAGVDVVYHLAGLTKANSYSHFCQVNEQGVRNVVAACAHRPTPPVVVIVSSLAAAGPTVEPRARTETDPLQPVSKYGRSKRAGELAAEALAAAVPITILRPPVVLGPGDVTGLALFRSIRRFRCYAVLRKPRVLSVVHVADLVSATIGAAQRGQRLINQSSDGHGYYFIAADEQLTFVELGRLVARAVGRPYAWKIRVPMAALWIAGAVGESLGQMTRRSRYMSLDRARDVAAGHWACSAEKAHRQLGFTVATPLAECIRQTAEWYRDHGWLRSIECRWPVRE